MPSCCVNGCNNRYSPASTVRFYRIPCGNRQFQIKRRRLWIEAIQRANGSSSKINADVRICGAHFITGEASTDPDRPNFVPTLFTCTKQRPASGPSRKTQWASGRQTRHRQNVGVETRTTTTTRREDAETEDTTTVREDGETEKSPTQPASESPIEIQSSALMETRDELLPEIQTLLCTLESKEEEADNEKIYDKDEVETNSKTEPETMIPENRSSLNRTPSPQKPPGGALKLDLMNPVVLLRPLVLPQGAYQVDLSDWTPTPVSSKEQHEETDASQTDLSESYIITRDQPSFPCNMCDRTFTTSHYLKRHKLLHVRDVRKCLRCGTLFCRRHNHVLFQTRPEPLPESEESSSSSEEEPLDDDVNTEKGNTSQVTEMPDNTLSTQTHTPPDSPPLSNSLVLMTPNLTDARKALLVSEKPAAVPSPPSPIFRFPNNQENMFQIRPLLSDTSPASIQPNLPQQPQLPSSLKIFSTQHLTSALLDVQRNYEYILSKPKNQVVRIKDEPEEPVDISPVEQLVEQPIKRVKLEKIAYDLEMVI